MKQSLERLSHLHTIVQYFQAAVRWTPIVPFSSLFYDCCETLHRQYCDEHKFQKTNKFFESLNMERQLQSFCAHQMVCFSVILTGWSHWGQSTGLELVSGLSLDHGGDNSTRMNCSCRKNHFNLDTFRISTSRCDRSVVSTRWWLPTTCQYALMASNVYGNVLVSCNWSMDAQRGIGTKLLDSSFYTYPTPSSVAFYRTYFLLPESFNGNCFWASLTNLVHKNSAQVSWVCG